MSEKKEEELLEKLEDCVENVMLFIKQLPEDSWIRSFAAERISFEAILWGSANSYEALGILEMTKQNYIRISEEIAEEDRAESCDCGECSKEESVVSSKYTC